MFETDYFYCGSVNMKGKDLFTNIQEAREHISRLKREAEMLEVSPQEATSNMHEYFNEVLYSLAKNEQEIDKKHKELKEKLPTIVPKREELPLLNGYRKQKRRLQSTHKSKRDESTKVEDSVSFVLENRQIKMHSFNEKHVKVEFSSDRIIPSVDILLPDQLEVNSKRSTPASSQFRSRHFDLKRPKPIDLNQSSKLAERKPHNSGYMQPNKPFLHEFDIIKGNIAVDSPEFASYQRVYESIFPKITEQLHILVEFLKQQEMEVGRLDGKKLAYLCLKDRISNNELLGCLINYNNLKPRQFEINPKYSGRDGRVKAVNKIISYWRMSSIRSKYRILRKNTIIIQRFFKHQLMKLNLEKKLRNRNQEVVDSFEDRQSRFYKEWKYVRNTKRIEIHLNSVEVDEEKRLSMDNFPERQNIQLSRMFRLKDQNLIIIYVTSIDLSPELLNYYYKMMELAGINNYRERLIFITPEHAHRFPQHYSATKLLYYSTRTMNQLKIITSDMPTILYPGYPCNELLKICHHLGCYLFSGEPQKMKCFTTKSQTKRLLKNLCIETLPSTMEMYDYGEFLNTFSVLIIKNPHIQTWVLKIDDEIAGRGIAYVDISSSKVIRSLLRKIDIQQNDNETFATEINSDSQNQEQTIKIRDYIRDHLHEKLQIATPSVYRTYTDFMGRFIKKGGVIEAHPTCLREQLTYPSVTFCLDPDGEHRIITTYEKITSQPFRPLACSFPQRSLQFTQITSIVRQLSDSFKLRKMFGIFTSDFLYQKDEDKCWVLGIDPYINDYTSSFFLFDLLMGGSYVADKNMYLVDAVSSTITEQSSPEERLATRDYIFVPHLHHRNLTKVKIKDFFKEARLEQFNFDVGNKEGICVILLDQLASGVLGLLAVSESKQQGIQTVKRMLDFISKMSSVKNVEYGRSELQGGSDAITLKDVLSVFTGMIRKGGRRNAKQRAIRQYQMNRDLQLI